MKDTQAETGYSQFSLLRQRRFLPFFCTQFLGAFNDNVYKNALLLLIAYHSVQFSALDSDVLNNIAAGLFILPFFLFSSLAGQLADKLDKGSLIRVLKITEMLAMVLAAAAFYYQSLWGLLLVLFLMGAQSAFFGPVKYSIMPQHLPTNELVSGNAFVEMGTFLAILLGTAGAGVVMQLDDPTYWVAWLVCVLAALGIVASRWVPSAPSFEPSMRIDWNPVRTSLSILKYTYANHTVFLAVLGISWFWFLGASYLTQLPNYTIEALGSQKSVVTLLLCTFSVGIGLGSLLCDRLSGHRIEIGIVPLGSVGLSLFGLDLYFASALPDVAQLRSLAEFLAESGSMRIIFDMLAIGIFGGFFIVPLYATVQYRTPDKHRARVIAANNILNALFMVIAAVLAVVLLGLIGLSKPQYFLILAVMNIAVAAFIYRQVPEFGMRFVVWLLSRAFYRVRSQGLDYIPNRGPVVLVCNHVSYVDALVLAGAVRRPVHFVMHKSIYELPLLNAVFRAAKVIPVASRREDPEMLERAFEEIKTQLDAGQVICIFPEGKLTRDGEIAEFKHGIERIIASNPVPVVPLALRNLWRSMFSHGGGRVFWSLPRRLWAQIDVVAGKPVLPEDVSVELLRDRVSELRDSHR